jgi:hypothetical protein
MSSGGKLILALSVAVVTGAIAGGLALGVLIPDASQFEPAWWVGSVGFGFVLLCFAIPLGLLPGLLLHALLLRLRWTYFWQYIAGGMLVGIFWCAVTCLTIHMPVLTPVFGYILTSSIVGTAAFWVARRPDKDTRGRVGTHSSSTFHGSS